MVLALCSSRPVGGRDGAHSYTGICLGNCEECFALLEGLPREPGAAAVTHLDVSRVGLERLLSFVEAPEVCRVDELFPLSVDRQFWSLAALTGGAQQLNFPGAAAYVRIAMSACAALRAAAVHTANHALRAAGECAGSEVACGMGSARAAVAAASAQWNAAFSASAAYRPLGRGPSGGFIAPAGNETHGIVAEYAARVHAALAASTAAAETSDGLVAGSRPALSAYTALAELALEVSRHTRLMMEHVRISWGIRNLASELMPAYPSIQSELPEVVFHGEPYGRHFDVLENLLLMLQAEQGSQPLRMAEMGVACGPIGLFLLLRFPDLQYKGADPTIRDEVYRAYERFGPRAKLNPVTSEEFHRLLPEEEQFDIVFIDGPHTYKNVRNDIEMWMPRIRSGGIVAGHDFTCAHPPLLWAVLEARMMMGGGPVNVGLDGVWWWRVP